MKIIYDLDKLVSVKIVDKKVDLTIIYREFKLKKYWWGKDVLEGYYNIYDIMLARTIKPYTQQDLETGRHDDIKYIIEDNKAFYKPYVKLSFMNDEKQIINCDSYEQAELTAAAYVELGINIPYEFS